MAVQDTIFSLEQGAGQIWLRRAGIALGAILLGLIYMAGQFRGLPTEHAMELAQTARNLSEGRGFSTSLLKPLALAQLSSHRGAPQGSLARFDDLHAIPDTSNPPVYPALLAAAFKLTFQDFKFTQANIKETQTFAPDRVAAIVGLLAFLASVWLLFAVASDLFDTRAAWAAVLLYVGTDLAWRFSISGTEAPVLMLLLTASAWAWMRALKAEEEGAPPGTVATWAAAGATFQALMVLTRYSWGWVILPTIAFAFLAFRSRAVAGTAILVILLLLPSLWLARNSAVSGNPFGAMWYAPVQDTDIYRAQALWGDPQPDFSKLTPKMIGRKAVATFRQQLENLPTFTGGVVPAALFLCCLLHRFRRWRSEALKWWVFAALLFGAAGTGLGIATALPDPGRPDNNPIVLLPLIALFAGAFLILLIDRMGFETPLIPRAVVTLAIALHALPLVLTILPPPEPPVRYPPYYPLIFHLTGSWLTRDEVMVSDLPAAAAWYGHRASVAVPLQMKDFHQLNDFALGGAVKGLLFGPFTLDLKLRSEIVSGPWKEWADILLARGIPKLFPLTAATHLPPPNGYFFMSDSERWNRQSAKSNPAPTPP